ncbi:sugar transferase [Flavobacterium sp. MAH-1]|uniref:Sugar transferase n=1 Tax=Flavobacterium agri TaxID=2743471 RepID=A0A7Y8Y1J0_9FLAO|nr:sugar transferase [Flavobacterium agri]NUY80880.1 sugar transferase [Flavobacterium agri]NYA70904.1 sugar transferase [Flavobacterium agri]
MYKGFLKRCIDFLAALVGLLLLSPIFIVVIVILSISNDGKPFFYQLRPGKNERIFKIIKFKTMNDRKDADGNLLPNIERITPLGAFVRKSSLDEIPQLINVLKGDMSLIGPRPLLPEYIPLYKPEQRHRHDVRPGITGWAQINGRNSISWQQKFAYDLYYVNNLSFALDMKILFKTVGKIVGAKDVNASKELIMPKFNGEN